MQTDTEIDERNAIRDEQILDAAARVIKRDGLKALTRQAIAEEAQLADGSISNFGRTRISNGAHEPIGYRERILAALMVRAQQERDVNMLRVGLVDGCLSAGDIPDDLRAAVGC